MDLSREVGALLLGIALELLTLSGQILLRGLLGTATQLAVQQRHGQQNDAPEDVGESLGGLERGERGDDERGGCGVAKQQCTRGDVAVWGGQVAPGDVGGERRHGDCADGERVAERRGNEHRKDRSERFQRVNGAATAQASSASPTTNCRESGSCPTRQATSMNAAMPALRIRTARVVEKFMAVHATCRRGQPRRTAV